MANARLVALKALRRVNEDDGYSNLVLDQSLKQAGLDERDSSLASILFYGVLEHRITSVSYTHLDVYKRQHVDMEEKVHPV